MATAPPDQPLSHMNEDERELLMRFLVLIRDNYRKAD